MAKKASDGATAQLVFKGNFQQDVSGEIKSGSEVAILFDSGRLPFERSLDEKGKSAWTISAFSQFAPGGEVSKVDLLPEKKKKAKDAGEETFLKGVLSVPAGSEEAIIWFLNTGKTGNEYYDSAFGNNYRFSVSPEAIETNGDSKPVKKPRTKKAKV
jgi:hypothetical protein